MSHTLMSQVSNVVLLGIISGILLFGYFRGVRVYDCFVEGAKEGIDVIVNIIPFMVAMVVGIGMLRASGALDHLASLISPALEMLGFPVDLMPLALVRPFSGAATNGVFVDILQKHGGDALISHMGGTMMGSTETTFYVVALYFGSIGIQRIRHAAWAGLCADTVGFMASIYICRLLLA